ncbi:MAG: ANTAR domain-containing protein [Jatrophihabitantaceae bacterium]
MSRISHDPVAPAASEVSVADLRADLAALVRSTSPAEVFADLARICVPMYCDACTISIVESSDHAYQIRWPHPNEQLDGPIGEAAAPRVESVQAGRAAPADLAQPAVAGQSTLATKPDPSCGPLVGLGAQPADCVRIPIEGIGNDYHGELILTFRRHRPHVSHALLGQVLVERAVSLIHQQRQAATAAAAAARTANLEIALASSREIGMAMGIVMDRYKLSTDQAFDLLSRISQHGRRKVREVAREIAETGAVELPPQVTVSGHGPGAG